MRLSILISFLVFSSLAAFAGPEEDFVIYQAQSRPASELQKAASGVLNGGRVSVMGSSVVVYGTKSQREAILHLFQELDHQLKNFIVSVRQAGRGSSASSASAMQADVNGQSVQLHKKSSVLTGSGTGTIGVRGRDGGVSVSAESNEGASGNNSGEQVVVLDGGSAHIYGGTVFPKSVSVSLRSLGKSGAHLEIREVDANAVGEQSIVTEINVPLGEWRSIGGIVRNDSGTRHELVGAAKRSSMSNLDVQVKVEAEAP